MQTVSVTNESPSPLYDDRHDNTRSGVSWSAVFAGAATAAVLTLVLFILGFGLGLSTLSPWHHTEKSTFAWSAVAWVAFTQIAASGLGGYLAGRLRIKWVRLHTDEVYFRDTAHGFLAWAVASLVTVAIFSFSTAMLANSSIKAGVTAYGGVVAASASDTGASGNRNAGSLGEAAYHIDKLFRNTGTAANPAIDASDRSETIQIFSHSLANGELSVEDKTYVAQLSARHTGKTPQAAETQVVNVYDQARDAVEHAKKAVEAARKAAAYTALWMFVALLCGAFVASVCATWGGRQRDTFTP